MWCWALIQIQPFSLYLAGNHYLYGYGLFKSNISCLLGELSTTRTIIDVMAVFAAVCCGQYRFYRRAHRLRPGCSVVWMACWLCLAGGGMFIGLLIFLSGHRHFQSTRSMDKSAH